MGTLSHVKVRQLNILSEKKKKKEEVYISGFKKWGQVYQDSFFLKNCGSRGARWEMKEENMEENKSRVRWKQVWLLLLMRKGQRQVERTKKCCWNKKIKRSCFFLQNILFLKGTLHFFLKKLYFFVIKKSLTRKERLGGGGNIFKYFAITAF